MRIRPLLQRRREPRGLIGKGFEVSRGGPPEAPDPVADHDGAQRPGQGATHDREDEAGERHGEEGHHALLRGGHEETAEEGQQSQDSREGPEEAQRGVALAEPDMKGDGLSQHQGQDHVDEHSGENRQIDQRSVPIEDDARCRRGGGAAFDKPIGGRLASGPDVQLFSGSTKTARRRGREQYRREWGRCFGHRRIRAGKPPAVKADSWAGSFQFHLPGSCREMIGKVGACRSRFAPTLPVSRSLPDKLSVP